MATRDELVAAIAGRYVQGDRSERGRILDEFTAVTGFHRKHAMRLLRVGQVTGRGGPRPGRRLARVENTGPKPALLRKLAEVTRVAIETTGLADPAPILHTLMTDPIVAARYLLDGVVTTIDAVNGDRTLDKQPEAVKQAAVADRLLLTKADLAGSAARRAIEARLKAPNPGAPIVPVAHGAVDPALLFNIGFYDPVTKSADVRRWLRDEAFDSDHEHEHDHLDVNRHDDRIRAFCVIRERPISWDALSAWLDALAEMRRSITAESNRRALRPPRSAGRVAWCAAFLPPAGPAARMADRGPSHTHGLITRDLPREAIETTLTAF